MTPEEIISLGFDPMSDVGDFLRKYELNELGSLERGSCKACGRMCLATRRYHACEDLSGTIMCHDCWTAKPHLLEIITEIGYKVWHANAKEREAKRVDHAPALCRGCINNDFNHEYIVRTGGVGCQWEGKQCWPRKGKNVMYLLYSSAEEGGGSEMQDDIFACM